MAMYLSACEHAVGVATLYPNPFILFVLTLHSITPYSFLRSSKALNLAFYKHNRLYEMTTDRPFYEFSKMSTRTSIRAHNT